MAAGGLCLAKPAWALAIVDQSCIVQSNNSMRYDCHVDLDAAAPVKVGFRPNGSTGAWSWSTPQYGSSLDFVLYNFEPGVVYDHRVQVVAAPVWEESYNSLAPDLPADLGDLNLDIQVRASTTSNTNFVLFDTTDCQGNGSYLVALDVKGGHIAWYLDMDLEVYAGATLQGWSWTEDGTILGVVSRRHVYEWDLTGAVLEQVDYDNCDAVDATDVGTCPHHDVFREGGSAFIHALTATVDDAIDPVTDTSDFATCGPFEGFVDDGFDVSSGGTVLDDYRLQADFGYDPTVDGGPLPVCNDGYWHTGDEWWDPSRQFLDWTHANSIYSTRISPSAPELVTLSMRQWSEVVQYNASNGSVLWRLNGYDSASRGDFDIVNDASIVTGSPEDFGGQHHVTEEFGHLQMFDNRTNVLSADDDARAIRLEVSPGSPRGTATIIKSWVLRAPGSLDTYNCTAGVGSAVTLPGTMGERVLVDCGPKHAIQELDESDGSVTVDPVLHIGFPGPGDFCAAGTDPTEDIPGWYRAWPLLKLGDF